MNRHEFLKTMAAATASILLPQYSWGDQPADCKTYTFKTAGGCELKLDAYGSDPKVRKPVMVTIHGGALIMGSRKGRPPQWMNPQDEYVVISIDYRLAPETKLPGIIEDVQDAFRWIHGTADTDVLYDAAVKMDAALAQGKVPHKLVTIPGGGHTFGGSTPQEIARVYAEALAFVKEHLT